MTGQTAMGWMWGTSLERKDRKYVMGAVVKRPWRDVPDKRAASPVKVRQHCDV